jgi:hypothetical protein
MTGGRLAAETVEAALIDLARNSRHAELDAPTLTRHLSAALQSAYERHGTLAEARRSDSGRVGSTLALAVDRGDRYGFFLIGDSGLRLNGREVIHHDKDLDRITATFRRFAYRRLAAAGADAAACEVGARALCWRGTRSLPPEARPWIDDTDLEGIRGRAMEVIVAEFPHVDRADALRLSLDGIVGAQGAYQNRRDHPLGYSCLDGFGPDADAMAVLERPKSDTSSLELFTDGYFAVPPAATVASWEAMADEVERTDPAKVDRYPSTKGSLGSARADDRTVVVVSESPPP